MEWRHGDDEDLYFPAQLFSPHHFCACCDYSAWDEFKQTDLYPLSFLEINLPNDTPEGNSKDERKEGFSSEEQKMGVEHETAVEEKKTSLSRETVAKYFYMPISEAAKEMKVGLTLLKKRCRELGIKRWPHRKLLSLQKLINNIKEMGCGEDENIRKALQNLEHEKRGVEEIPDVELERSTKRLRQSYFKATYKKRRILDTNSTPLFASHRQNLQVAADFNGDMMKDDEFQSFFSDLAFSSDIIS